MGQVFNYFFSASDLFEDIFSYAEHTTYSWNIKWQKCAGMVLNGFMLKKYIKILKQKKILGAV